MSNPQINNEEQYLVSISDLILTVHKIETKVSKLYEVLGGDKEMGTDGVLTRWEKRIHALESKVETLNNNKNKLMGMFVMAGFIFAYIWEIGKNFFTHK